MGRCTGFDNDGQPEQFVRHDQAPCVLFNRVKNRVELAQRARFIAKHQQVAAPASA
jgi:hypothetical protein